MRDAVLLAKNLVRLLSDVVEKQMQRTLLRTAMTNKLLTTKEAAIRLGVSAAFLERDRWAGAIIPFVRVGSRAVRYRQEDLDDYVASRRRTSTSDIASRKEGANGYLNADTSRPRS